MQSDLEKKIRRRKVRKVGKKDRERKGRKKKT